MVNKKRPILSVSGELGKRATKNMAFAARFINPLSLVPESFTICNMAFPFGAQMSLSRGPSRDSLAWLFCRLRPDVAI